MSIISRLSVPFNLFTLPPYFPISIVDIAWGLFPEGQFCDDDKAVNTVCLLLPPCMPHGTIAGDTASQLRDLQHTCVEHSGLGVWYTPQYNLRVLHKQSGDTSLTGMECWCFSLPGTRLVHTTSTLEKMHGKHRPHTLVPVKHARDLWDEWRRLHYRSHGLLGQTCDRDTQCHMWATRSLHSPLDCGMLGEGGKSHCLFLTLHSRQNHWNNQDWNLNGENWLLTNYHSCPLTLRRVLGHKLMIVEGSCRRVLVTYIQIPSV